MKTFDTRGFVAHFRRAGPPALLAACLAVGPVMAQSTTVTTTEKSDTDSVKIKEKKSGDVVIKSKDKDDGDNIKQKTTIDEDGDVKTKTTVK